MKIKGKIRTYDVWAFVKKKKMDSPFAEVVGTVQAHGASEAVDKANKMVALSNRELSHVSAHA